MQSYILVERSLESNGLAVDSIVEEYLHVVSSVFALASLAFVLRSNKILDTSLCLSVCMMVIYVIIAKS